MAKINEFKRLVTEDFAQDDRELVSRLGNVLNIALEQMFQALNRNLTISDNFNGQVKEIDISVDADGKPKLPTSFRSEVRGSIKGLWVVRAQNLTNPIAYPTSAPFITYDESGDQIIIKHITGLVPNAKYKLRLISVG